jgi:hypothetical protein
LFGVAVWVRLAPLDPARWHADLAAPGFAAPAHWAIFCPEAGSRFDGVVDDPAHWLGALRDIALATPRTRVLAGSPEEGRITFVTRSRLLGYPDVTTAAAVPDGTGRFRVCLFARQVYGQRDFGVNEARVQSWAQALFGFNEAPDLRRP